jgi:drug/metabolite transporter (DMT)-like permease
VSLAITVAIVLALASTTLTNLAYLREHDAAVDLPVLCMRRPLQSARLLLEDRSWMLGFAMESSGFLLYAAALALAPLALVQSIAAGGIGVLAFASARFARRRLTGRELTGAVLSVTGLLALALSLAGGSDHGSGGAVASILLWLGVTLGVAVVLVAFGRHLLGPAVTDAVAGGLLFSIGDVSTKLVTQGGDRLGFIATVIVGYTAGTALLQRGYQAGGALTVAGVATLLTSALPIVAGTIVLGEPLPPGAFGGIRLLAFAAVIAGAVLLARPEKPANDATMCAVVDEAPRAIGAAGRAAAGGLSGAAADET